MWIFLKYCPLVVSQYQYWTQYEQFYKSPSSLRGTLQSSDVHLYHWCFDFYNFLVSPFSPWYFASFLVFLLDITVAWDCYIYYRCLLFRSGASGTCRTNRIGTHKAVFIILFKCTIWSSSDYWDRLSCYLFTSSYWRYHALSYSHK